MIPFLLLLLAGDGWLVQSTDKPKTIVILEQAPENWQFEFWIGGDAPILNRRELIEILDRWVQEKEERPLTAKRKCRVDTHGVIQNYPCRISITIRQR